jgi:hypothetical protein
VKSDWKDYQYHEVDGRALHIFDNLINYDEREHMYAWCSSRDFCTTGNDTQRPEHLGDFNLFSPIEWEDIETRCPLARAENIHYLSPFLEGYIRTQSRVNLSTLHDKDRFHTDGGSGSPCLTLLYYPHMTWDKEWGGYTLFTDRTGKNLEFVSFYEPGRIILFDGLIPHCISNPNPQAPFYRLSFVIQYVKDNS